ncbi:MAG: homocysteine S-methyltransferase family protein [Defluviitaleaceae bacterium]|nr:homocysteine S-methyltransferase family protein [Defluviitaleaceae bacterium]
MDRLGKEIIFFDGGMGTLLQAQGLDVLPEIWNVTNPQAILDIHSAYAAAGCDIIKANTFGASRIKLAGSGYEPSELITAGIKLAKKAANAATAKVAMDISSLGKLLAPVGELEFEEAVDVFAEMVKIGAKAGADLILIETMSDTYEIKAAMLAAKENCDLPIMVTFSPDENGRLLTGADILTVATLVESLGACAVGLNCGFGPFQMKELLEELLSCVNIPVIFNPNGGMPKIVDGKTVFDLSPEDYAAQMVEMAKMGAAVLGGCCGTTPAHIGAMIKEISELQNIGQDFFKAHSVKDSVRRCFSATRASSFSQTVILGNDLKIIGERINPTGKPKLKKALADNDMNFICNEALTQAGQGAHLLDVNVGLPGINEKEMLVAAVKAVQGICGLPLVIDTSDVSAAEAALRIYNGKPLLNSVNGKDESLSTILPLAKKYGAAVVALTLDDEGIPETFEGRVAIAERIIAAAAKYGIPKSDIVVDALTMTLSTNTFNAKITLDAVDYLTREVGVCTVLGLSNISFGLPQRGVLNAGFLALAADRGLSAAISNPASSVMADTIAVAKALAGRDENCAEYVERFSQAQEEATKPTSKSRTAYEAIISGLDAEAKAATQAMLADTEPMEIINTQLIPALDNAGKTFGEGKTFLPQLLKSASAATASFDAINSHMVAQGAAAEKRGKIVMATVKGDIHDIGKNIVCTLLKNYNFDVLDLGKNVDPEVVLQAVQTEKIPLVGLSALMTTTVANMEETIALLRKEAPTCKIMVGGAVLTESHAKKIGADFYSPDAMGSVRYAEEVFGVTQK